MNTIKERQRPVQPTDAVVRAVASVRDVDPVDLNRPLFMAVDPDALDRLFESRADGLSVTFRYHGHDVEVRSDLTVVVDGTAVEPER
ncbi:HalOD1 output domain-containing protein [Halorientalis brevis]|uniref:HalOD1 output domain-containing protein n=1 Tax=Halorientalis brevis TaxID=1126241 RepID=A0ABD6C6Y1_9EURY|nr:HalOD1 output domain-containing protein [Halorientalis brevis]